MKYILILLTLGIMSNAADTAQAAAPNVFEAYCLALAIGVPPQGQVRLKSGESKIIGSQKGLTYRVAYGDVVGLQNVIQLEIFNEATKWTERNYVAVDGNFPKRIDFITATGGLSCWTR